MVMGSSRGAEPKAKPMQVEDGATDRDKDKDRDKGKGKDRERDKGKGKGKEAFGKGKDGEQKICPWFAKSSEGCRRGKTCRDKHSFEGISKRGRCLECGGEGHIAADCPTKALASRPSSSTGGKGGGGGHSQPSRAKEEPAARSMVSEPEPQPTSPVSTTTSASSPNPELQSAMTDAAQALRSLVGEGAGGGHPGLASIQRQLDELRLRALRVEDVVVRPRGGDPRMFKAELDVPTVLIDSGATNILRQPRDPHELQDANQVSVVLANNERTQLYQTPAGSILTPSTTTQPLLPMGDLVRAGCEISWGRKGMKIVHPTLGVLRTSVKAGCPELTMAEADKIIEQVENAKLQEFRDEVQTLQMKLEALKVGANTAPWTTHLDDYVASGSRNALWKALMGLVFGELPEALRTRLCVELNLAKGWDYLKALPLPRRVKKSFLQAPEWILHLPAHENEDGFLKVLEQKEGRMVLKVAGNIEQDVYQALLWAAVEGKLKCIVAGGAHGPAQDEAVFVKSAQVKLLYCLARLASKHPEEKTGFVWSGPERNLNGASTVMGETASPSCCSTSTNSPDTARAIRVSHPSLFVLNIDIAGPFRTLGVNPHGRGRQERNRNLRYMLVAKYTLPESYITNELEETADDPEVEVPEGEADPFAEDEGGGVGLVEEEGIDWDDYEPDLPDDGPVPDPEQAEDPDKEIVVGTRPREIPEDVKAPKAANLLFAHGLADIKGSTVASVVQGIVLYLRNLNLPVLRFHSDKAAQFTNKGLVQWLHGQDDQAAS